MSFDLNGYVLRPARVASGNSPDSNEATTGVDRDHILPATLAGLGYEVLPERPVEPYADMYRAAVLERPSGQQATEQYCMFAATTGSLSTLDLSGSDAMNMVLQGGRFSVSVVDPTETFAQSFYVRDAGQRDISKVISITVQRGDTGDVVVCLVTTDDPTVGKVTLTSPGDLGGGFNEDRGDVFVASAYVLARPTFWWSRNDKDLTRFGWDGKTSRWLPLKGGRAYSLGAVKPGETYKLVPPPSRFAVADSYPVDSYALVRVGLYSDEDSTPVRIKVVTDVQAEDGWDGSPSDVDAIVGVTNGVLVLNPDEFAVTEAGRTLWYNPETYLSDATGDLGALVDFPTDTTQGFPSLSPVPGPTERPFLRIGSRRYLTPIPKDSDAEQDDPVAIPSGHFQWSRTTGRIVLSQADLLRSTPGDPTYQIPFLGARLYFDGVAMNMQPVSIKQPVAALNENGDPLDGAAATVGGEEVFIPRSVCMPPPGISGVRWTPDNTGTRPTVAALTAASTAPQSRPRGSGLVRSVKGEGDTFLFSSSYAFEDTKVVEYDGDLPTFNFRVAKGAVEVARCTDTDLAGSLESTSRVQFRRRPVRGEMLYFAQADVVPSVYADEARIYSRSSEPYTLTGNDTLRFALDGVVYTWSSSALGAGEWSAADVATSLISDAGLPPEAAGAFRGRVFLRAVSLTSGSVEIGWNETQDDLTGHAALGFLPGWRVDLDDTADRFRWLPDNGAAMGVFRSPVNMDRTNRTPDIRAVSRLRDQVLSESVPENPFVTLTPPPLLDVPGYTDTSHFQITLGLLKINLENYQTTLGVGVVYDWVNDRFVWSSEGETKGTQVTYPSSELDFQDTGVFPETVDPDAMLDSSFGLKLRRAKDQLPQTLPATFPDTPDDLDLDFRMPGSGAPGQAVLVSIEGGETAAGGKGVTTAGVALFGDPNVADQADFWDSVEVGYLLHVLTGEAPGVYTVVGKNNRPVLPEDVTALTVNPPFTTDESALQWRVYEAKTRDEYDATLLADVTMVPTNHFAEEPFQIRVLSSAGTVTPGGYLSAQVADAIKSKRAVRVRFGLVSESSEAVPVYLTRGVKMGALAETLRLPDVSDPHVVQSVVESYFQIRVGTKPFTTALGNMTLNTGTAPAGGVDVNTTTGKVVVDAAVLDVLGGSEVYYDQSFLAPGLLAEGTCEIDAATGEINTSEDDRLAYDGVEAYFVERMVTENSLDVATSPLNGSIFFITPLRAGQIVEASYCQADTNGDKKLDEEGNPIEITEFLPVLVTLEKAAYVNDTQWAFNPTGRTYSDTVDPFIWIGVDLMNFAGETNALVKENTINISRAKAAELEVDSSTSVQINYGVLEAFGGEQTYSVSTTPVYRKPFWLNAEQSTFTLGTNRTEDFVTGKVMLLGLTPFYIEGVVYDAGADTTQVTVFPTPAQEVGSRAVGQDAALYLSDFVVSVDRGGAQGFMALLNTDPTTGTPLLEADRNQNALIFFGDCRRFMQANHLLEVGGYPYLIGSSEMSEDGYNTIVRISNPTYKEHDNSDVIRVSLRPMYISPSEFVGLSPFLSVEEYDLFLLGSRDSDGNLLPGQQLVEGVHYSADEVTGDVSFLRPTQDPLQAGEYLHFRYTAQVQVGPEVSDGAALYPVYRSKYLFFATPSIQNRLLGSVLKAEYTYRNQDSFFFAVETLADYLGEVAEKSATQGIVPVGSGPTSYSAGSTDPSDYGTFGLRGQADDADNTDRAARVFIEFFNAVIVGFEQVLETIDGRVIGDRDGKFRFFIGHDKRYSPPGYEDEITGRLNPRLIWREIIDTWSPGSFENAKGYYRTNDPVFLPTTAEVPEAGTDADGRPGETDGDAPDPVMLDFFTALQRRRVKNDMDDRLLIKMARPRFRLGLFTVYGDFDSMWESHKYSRLYPERTKHFSRLFPGINHTASDPGFYTFGRDIEVPGPRPGEITEQTVSTYRTQNGVITNPALGTIENVLDVEVANRLPRARVWAYYPSGNADLAPSSSGFATLVATPVTLGSFPIDETTGLPDVSLLRVNGGEVDDLTTGDEGLSTPAFEVGQRVAYGKPDGSTYTLKDVEGNGIFIAEVVEGCVLVLGDKDLTPLSGGGVFVGSSSLESVVSDGGGLGDTVYVILGLSGSLPPSDDLPTSTEDLAGVAGALPYRLRFDLGFSKRGSEFRDLSLPTTDDNFPLPLQDWFGQNPPDPLSCVEGSVEMVNTRSEPAKLPCLLGEDKDDTGDYTIPYMRGYPTELVILGEVEPTIEGLYLSSAAVPYAGVRPLYTGPDIQQYSAVLPTEVVVQDGTIPLEASFVGYARNPATFYTEESLSPSADEGNPASGSGLGDLRAFDLMLVETTSQPVDLWTGAEGILRVSAVENDLSGQGRSTIEVPRFVAHAAKGLTHRYALHGWAAHVAERTTPLTGVELGVNTPVGAGIYTSTLDFSSVPNMPDLTLAESILNAPAPAGWNLLVIRIYDPNPAFGSNPFVGAITVRQTAAGNTIYFWNNVTSTLYKPVLDTDDVAFAAGTVTVRYDTSAMPVDPNTPLETLLGMATNTPYDFRLDMDTYGSTVTVDEVLAGEPGIFGNAAGSATCALLRDRLTFTEELDLTLAKPRGYGPANDEDTTAYGIDLAAQFNMVESTLGGTASDVNHMNHLNDGAYFTYLERYDAGTVTTYVGTWDGTDGALRAMSWEGQGNVSLPSEITEIKLAAMPASDVNATEGIFAGGLRFWDGDSDLAAVPVSGGPVVLEGNRNYLLRSVGAPDDGSLSNVEHGDTCVVLLALGDDGGVIKEGTYVVRHAVPASDPVVVSDAGSVFGSTDLYAVKPDVQAGDDGCLDLTFPKIGDVDGDFITLTNVAPVTGSPTGCGWEDPSTTSVRLYLIRNSVCATYSDDANGSGNQGWALDESSVYSVDVLSIEVPFDPETGTITLGVDSATAVDAAGNGLNWNDDFVAAAAAGTRVSGMQMFGVKQLQPDLPTNNLVGVDLTNEGLGPLQAYAGIMRVTVGNRNPTTLAALTTLGETDDLFRKFDTNTAALPTVRAIQHGLAGAQQSNRLSVGIPLPEDNTATYASRVHPVYGRMYDPTGSETDPVAGVATYLHAYDWTRDGVGDKGGWNVLHFGEDVGSALGNRKVYDTSGAVVPLADLALDCLLPFDRVALSDDITDPVAANPGFFAVSGVFLEPSVPRPVQDINTVVEKVVAESYTGLTTDDIGARDAESFGATDPYEEVYVAVRRPRRWHGEQTAVVDLLQPLRFVYQMRRGAVAGYSESTRIFSAAAPGTNLGPLDDPDVNINSGDVLRVLNADGDLVDTAEIQRVVSGTVLKLRRPGLTHPGFLSAPSDYTFEVYLEQPMIPHEQSNEQLFSMVANDVVYRRTVERSDPATDAGGESSAVNVLHDSELLATPGFTWESLGVQKGDYIIVDPAGDLYTDTERGQRPFGDRSVSGRTPYEEGGPSKLDDNRGFYRVEGVDENNDGPAPGYLLVTGDSRFTDGEVFGDAAQDSQYVVMPTVNGSDYTPDGLEDQQALRPTARAVGSAFLDRSTGSGANTEAPYWASIAPFSYTIVRPSNLFSQDARDLILFMRERTLSWIEELDAVYTKGGDYYTFQREDHIKDVGSLTDPSAGLGLLSNLILDSLRGLVDEQPFANTSDCLSILDRRFWCLDYRLDAGGYTQFTTGDFAQRPVLPDLIGGVLDTDDRFRPQRYGWITFRTNREDGSIRVARRERGTLGRRLEKQREALIRAKGLDQT